MLQNLITLPPQHRRGLLVIIASILLACHGPAPVSLTTSIEGLRQEREALGNDFAIASAGEASTQAGKAMFELGGNAIDAAAAISFAIAVERPQSTGIGGGGFMMLRLAELNQVVAVDFREKAPLAATANMYQDKKGNVIPKLSTEGVLSGAVPGMVAGILEVQAKYGKLTREQVLAPAIALAQEGFIIYPHLAKAIAEMAPVLRQYPASRQLFFNAKGQPLKVGDRLKQPLLAKTLENISVQGRAGFYQGWVAQALLRESQRLGGLLTQQDLDRYEVKYRTPVQGTYKGYAIYSMPPPSSGGTHVIEILNMLENDSLVRYGATSSHAIHRTAAAMQQAFADRAKYLGDSDFVAVPLQGLTSKSYARQLRAQIGDKARLLEQVNPGTPTAHESDQTTHFSVIDRAGNLVASTQTVNGWLGSGIVVPQAGFILNNEMDDFSAKTGAANMFGAIGGDNNAIAPEKRPLSSMSPTIVMQGKQPLLAVGSPSGTRIISCVALTILNYLEYKQPLYEAVAAIRYHHQWQPDEIRVDSPGFNEKTAQRLQAMGYKINVSDLGCSVQAVAKEGASLHAVADPRGTGLALAE